MGKSRGLRFARPRQVGALCQSTSWLELILSKTSEVLRSNKGGVKGEGIVAELGFVRSATAWLRLTPYGRKLQLTPLRGVR